MRPIIIWTAHVPVFRLSSGSFCPLNNLNAVIFLPFYRELPPRKSLFELLAGYLKALWYSYFMGCLAGMQVTMLWMLILADFGYT